MAAQSDSQHWHEIRQIQKDHIDFYKLLGVGLLILLGVWIGRATYPGQEWAFGMNLSTELVGIALTVGIIEWFNQRRALRQYQQQLVDDVASISNEIAKNAVYQIRRKGWLYDEKGLLRGTNLESANLQGANLALANLQGAVLAYANLQGAALFEANLQGATLWFATFDDATVLPDESRWTLETDMRRFTDPEHPNFWRSDNAFSPAYRGTGAEG